MKNENQKIAAQCWAGISARGPTLLAWPSGTVAQSAQASRRCASAQRDHMRGNAVVRPAWLHRWPRSSASGGDSTGER
jgi:hypothetical protein